MTSSQPLLVDSHCHLNLIHDPNEEKFEASYADQRMAEAKQEGIGHLLCPAVDFSDYEALRFLAERYNNLSFSIGLHPNNFIEQEPSTQDYIDLAKQHPACVALGETGLDYYRTEDEASKKNQQQRFRNHIQAAKAVKKPLIIHTREAGTDTLLLLKEEKAEEIGGVMHCFSESLAFAEEAIAMNFYISFSGIITFKNAETLRSIAKKIPAERLLIETDAPYLAPVPYRGKQNAPAYVKYVALMLAELRETSYENIAQQTSENFFRLFQAYKL